MPILVKIIIKKQMEKKTMKIKLLLPLLITSILAGCGATPTSSEEPITSTPVTSETTSEAPSVTSEEITSEDDLPPAPGSSEGGPVETGNVTFDASIPSGWTYITNDVKYPNPEFYADGGLKLNFANQAIKSPVYPSSITSITLAGKLNKNAKTTGAPTTLTILKVDGANEVVVDSVVFSTTGLTTFTNSFTITGGTSQFIIKLTSNVGYNVNLNTITLG